MRRSSITATHAYAATAWLLLAACRDQPSPAACEKLFDKTVELYAAPNGTKGLSPDQKAEYEQSLLAMRKQLGPGFITQCRGQYSPTQVDCQLRARTLSALTACWPQ